MSTSLEAPPHTACGFAGGELTSSPVHLLRLFTQTIHTQNSQGQNTQADAISRIT